MTSLYHLKNVTYSYSNSAGNNDNFILSNINIDIKKSHIIAIVGPNGSGKTSLLNILSFHNLPNDGSLIYNEKELGKNNIAQFKKTTAYVQQNPYLLRGSVFKNIELGLKLKHVDKEIRVKKVFEIMQLLDITKLTERSARLLSGGEAQKVAIAQVLVLDPEVLILDEPFTYLDKKSIQDLEQLIITLKDKLNKTVIFTTHNQIQAQCLADDVYSVVKGNVFEAHLINLFSGAFDVNSNLFDTGKLLISIPDGVEQAEHIAIDPKQIVISKDRLDSSMQNSFSGKIIGMNEEGGQIKLSINIGEQVQATITHKALENLKLSIGSDVWISFKSSSILIF